MSEPSTTNGAATVINKVVETVVNVAVMEAKLASIAAVPFLGLPVINQVYSFILDKFSGYLYVALANYATFTVIDIQVGTELNNFNQAAADLKAAQAKGIADASTKQKFKDALASLIHYNGSAHP